MSTIEAILIEQRSKLALAKQTVAKLEAGIATLEAMLHEEDDFDKALTTAVHKKSDVVTDDAEDGTSSPTGARLQYAHEIEPSPTGRNPRGVVRKLLLELLADGEERDLDYLEIALNDRAPSTVTRGALRTTLMTLKNAGLLTSRKPGVFQQAKKGETPLGGGVSSATMSSEGQPTLGV